jgi:hypothetical protein
MAPIVVATTRLATDLPNDSARCAYCETRILFGGKRQGQLTFCSEACRQAGIWLSASQQIPDHIVKERVQSVFAGACPVCGGPGPVDVHTSHRVVSALIVTSWKNRPALACRSCGNKARIRDALVSLGLGWWGLPWGVIMTPVQIVRNIAGLVSGSDVKIMDEQEPVQLSVGWHQLVW